MRRRVRRAATATLRSSLRFRLQKSLGHDIFVIANGIPNTHLSRLLRIRTWPPQLAAMLRARGRGAVPNVRRPAASVRVAPQPAHARGPRVAHSGQVGRPAAFARHHGTSATPDAPKKGGGVSGFVVSLGKRETWKHFWEVAKVRTVINALGLRIVG